MYQAKVSRASFTRSIRYQDQCHVAIHSNGTSAAHAATNGYFLTVQMCLRSEAKQASPGKLIDTPL